MYGSYLDVDVNNFKRGKGGGEGEEGEGEGRGEVEEGGGRRRGREKGRISRIFEHCLDI